jgi:hypothetical protein
MDSPAPAATQANGVAALSRPDSPASINSSTKRKRESTDDNAADPNAAEQPEQPINGVHASQDRKALVGDFFGVLERYAPPCRPPLCCHGCSIAPPLPAPSSLSWIC